MHQEISLLESGIVLRLCIKFVAWKGTDSNLKGDYCVIQPILHQGTSTPSSPLRPLNSAASMKARF